MGQLCSRTGDRLFSPHASFFIETLSPTLPITQLADSSVGRFKCLLLLYEAACNKRTWGAGDRSKTDFTFTFFFYLFNWMFGLHSEEWRMCKSLTPKDCFHNHHWYREWTLQWGDILAPAGKGVICKTQIEFKGSWHLLLSASYPWL